MKVGELINKLNECNKDEDITVSLEDRNIINFYSIESVSLSGDLNYPVMINISNESLEDSNV